MTYKACIGLAISSVLLLLPQSAHAQGPISDGIRRLFEPSPPPYPGQSWQDLPTQTAISREQLSWLLQLSGGIDQFGYLQNQVPVNQIIPLTLSTGAFRFPMAWDSERSVVLQVENGNIVRMEYVLPR